MKSEYSLVGNGTTKRVWVKSCGQAAYCRINNEWPCLVLNNVYSKMDIEYSVTDCVVTCGKEVRNLSREFIVWLGVVMNILLTVQFS